MPSLAFWKKEKMVPDPVIANRVANPKHGAITLLSNLVDICYFFLVLGQAFLLINRESGGSRSLSGFR
jgi:hypothetical protein